MYDPVANKRDLLQHGQLPWNSWSLDMQGKCVEVTIKDNIPYQGGAPKRGPIRTFSRQSQQRMRRVVAKIDWEKTLPALFVTLTTPDDIADTDPTTRTAQQESFHASMERYMGKQVSALWRVEWKRRRSGQLKGKIVHHFHLIIPNVRYIPHRLLLKWWQLALGWEEWVSVWVRKIYSPLMCAHYCAKYLTKNLSLDYGAYLRPDTSIGRQWGVKRGKEIPRGLRQRLFHMWEEDQDFLWSLGVLKCKEFGKYGEKSFTLYGDEVVEGIQLFFEDRLETVPPKA